VRKRSDRWPSGRRRLSGTRAVAALLAAALLAPRTRASSVVVDAASLPPYEEALLEARRAGRELRPGPNGRDPFARLNGSAGLWALRSRVARAASALARGDADAARADAAGLDASPLGLPDLTGWILLSTRPEVPGLVQFVASAKPEPLARAALLLASRIARTPAEKAQVEAAFRVWRASTPQGVRAESAAAVVQSSLTTTDTPFQRLAQLFPDAPERAPDLYDDADRERFVSAVRHGTPELRLARARAILSRQSWEALDLVRELPRSPANRLAIAELQLSSGHPRDALKELNRPMPLVFGEEAQDLHVGALRGLADIRLALEPKPMVKVKAVKARKAKGKKGKASPPPPPPAKDTIPEAAAKQLLASADALLAQPRLTPPDRRRLLEAAGRLMERAESAAAALRYIEPLLADAPDSSAGSDELFAEAFALYRKGDKSDLITAARSWQRQAALYREPGLRRRATYWSARARERLGDLEGARTTYATLLPGAAPDLYARWSAAALGVTLMPGPTHRDDREPVFRIPATEPGKPSRELLTCGFPDLAEDAAEAEGTLDPIFAAVIANERGDFRRATALLKAKFPALGTPEEGAVPMRIRRTFYPLAHADLITATARQVGLPPALLFGVIRQESIFQPVVRSHAGAIGLMQVMPATGRDLLRQENGKGRPNLTDPEVNLRLGARYLAQLVRRFDGDVPAALAAYNAGPNRVARWREEGRGLKPDEFVETIPITEPRVYVKKVLYYEAAYQALYGS